MRLLLDTHAFLWAISDEPRLGPRSRDLITTEASSVLISHVSLWEIAIKHALTRSDMPLSAAQAIPSAAGELAQGLDRRSPNGLTAAAASAGLQTVRNRDRNSPGASHWR